MYIPDTHYAEVHITRFSRNKTKNMKKLYPVAYFLNKLKEKALRAISDNDKIHFYIAVLTLLTLAVGLITLLYLNNFY